MPISKSTLIFNAALLASTVTTIGLSRPALSQNHPVLNPGPKQIVDAVWHIVDQNYVDASFNQTDWQAVRTEYLGRSYENSDAAYEAIREMLETLDDPYTQFLDPKEFQDLQVQTSGELTGVGIQLSQDEETEKLVVVSPIEDTPAFAAGILSQDVIVAIDGESTEGMDLTAAVRRIRGPIGSAVTLTVQRGDEELEFEIVRARIEIQSVRYNRDASDPDIDGIGYIRLTVFDAHSAADMRKAIQDLEEQGVSGYILDLRNNSGGLLTAGLEITRMWLDRGTIVSTVNRSGRPDSEIARGKSLTDKPLVVLVDGGSASASEIVAGALQDNDRAQLVGSKTFGKATVQSVRSLPDSSGLRVTVAKYLTPSGRDIDKSGIEPDVTITLTEAEQEERVEAIARGETVDDPQYDAAISALKQTIAAKGAGSADQEADKRSSTRFKSEPVAATFRFSDNN